MNLFARRDRPALVGVVHLLPLPGCPLGGDLDRALSRALEDAQALARGGADAAIVENLGDAPFSADRVPPITVAAMTRVLQAITEAVPGLPLGVNVLRNDAAAAMSLAAVTAADFIRVNIHTGTLFTDQGPITGRAPETLRLRRELNADIRIAADILCKHATPPGPMDLVQVARDTFLRGRADALIVSGSGTGQPTSRDDLERVRAALPEAPLWVGSGLTPASAADLPADVAIVGTWLHQDARLDRPLDPARVATMRAALAG